MDKDTKSGGEKGDKGGGFGGDKKLAGGKNPDPAVKQNIDKTKEGLSKPAGGKDGMKKPGDKA